MSIISIQAVMNRILMVGGPIHFIPLLVTILLVFVQDHGNKIAPTQCPVMVRIVFEDQEQPKAVRIISQEDAMWELLIPVLMLCVL
jgi:hypothetical protein